MKTYQKSILSLSLGAALAAGSGLAQANSLLFPFFTTVGGAQSVISLASSPEALSTNFPEGNNIHYVYNYSQSEAGGSSCAHYDGYGSMTVGDLLQHSIAAPNVGGFGNVVGTDQSAPFFFPLSGADGRDGFLVVSNLDGNGRTSTTPDLVGSMVVSDPTSGMLFAYKAISNNTGVEGDFSNLTQLDFTLSWYPDAVANTAWYGVVVGNMNGAISTNTNWLGAVQWSNGGVVRDNDEAAFSGTSGGILTCRGLIPRDSGGTGSLDVAGLLPGLPFPLRLPIPLAGVMTDAQQAAINNGGVAQVGFRPINGVTTGVVLGKLEAVQPAVGAPFAGTLVRTANARPAAAPTTYSTTFLTIENSTGAACDCSLYEPDAASTNSSSLKTTKAVDNCYDICFPRG